MYNKIEDGNNLREVIDIVDFLNFQKSEDLFELSQIYEDLLRDMGNAGGNNGEFYTPRCLIKIMVECIEPKIGQTVYDPSAGSCGFLIEAYNFISQQEKTDGELLFLQNQTLYGNEKTPLAYVMGVMNMILHGIKNPNIRKTDTLAMNIKDFQEKDRFDIILANPPFGGKIKSQVQINFPVRTNATEMLFLQHIMKSVKIGGKTAIIVPEGVLFNTGAAFGDIKRDILNSFNLHSIISLPAGVFLPYAGVKTNVIFFDREGSTKDIWFYEINLDRKLTKNKPLQYTEIEHIPELLKKRAITENSWIVAVDDIKDFDISAKNPNKKQEAEIRKPQAILTDLQQNEAQIRVYLKEMQDILL